MKDECKKCCYCSSELYTTELTYLELKDLWWKIRRLSELAPEEVAENDLPFLERKCDEAIKNGENRV